MSLTIRAEDLKALKKFEWSPSGVCALVGPNGAGKSTALRIIQMIQKSLEVGYDDGLRVFGAGPLTNLDSRIGVASIALNFGSTSWKLKLERTALHGIGVFDHTFFPCHKTVRGAETDILIQAYMMKIFVTFKLT